MRFLDKAVQYRGSDCLAWPFGTSRGYGSIHYEGKTWIVSRLVCTLVNGTPPDEKMEAAHSCGNGHLGCCNPAHIRWVTSEQNGLDMILHGTSLRGERHPRAKLTEDNVREIRRRRTSGEEGKAIADDFDIRTDHVYDICARKFWSHVE